MLTKKHFEAIAEILASERQRPQGGWAVAEWYILDRLTVKLADWLAQQNPEFDRDRFYRAAGMEGPCEASHP